MKQSTDSALSLADLLGRARIVMDHRPWPRALVASNDDWRQAAKQLARGHWSMLGLWGEPGLVHLAVRDPGEDRIAVLSLECPDDHYPSIGQHHPPAIRLERAMRDLFGLVPEGLPDMRPWPDHGRWGVRYPLGANSPCRSAPEAYEFLPVEGEHLHRIPVGPVHAGIIEPGHFRFTCAGETIVRLEARLGYTHKGIEGLMAGAKLEHASRLSGRVSGDSSAAYALAFAHAVEAALGCEPPARAIWLRALLAELERLANHLGDIGAICNDAAFPLMHAHCGILRERVIRANQAAFGHRQLRDCIVPGGVAVELEQDGLVAIRTLLGDIRRHFPELIELYDNTASLQDRTVGAGILEPDLARRFAAGGFVGRASGRDFDARVCPAYAPYDQLRFEVPVLTEGDVNARIWVRIREVEQSLGLIEQILDQLPDGPVSVKPRTAGGEGMALVEGFRGDILVWLRLDEHGRIDRCHLRDPSWFQWPLLEAAVEGNIVADFPLCNKSFNCSYSGHDL